MMRTTESPANGPTQSLGVRVDAQLDRLFGVLRRLDPAPRPYPISAGFIVCFSFAMLLTVWLIWANKYFPGQDVPYHAHASRVWIDGGVPGSAYARYEPRHPLEANTLMFSVAGVLSIFGNVFTAYRIAYGYYLVGLPVACFYALRSLGRSPWGSLLAFPLCYGEVFSAGYANMSFGAPTFIFALVAYRRFVLGPSWRRGLVVALLFCAVFLSHAHVFLWLGALVLLYSVCVLVVRVGRVAVGTPGDDLRSLLVTIGGAAAIAVPSLLLFWRWYARGYGAGHSVGAAGNNVSFAKALMYAPVAQKFMNGPLQAFASTPDPMESGWLMGVLLVATFAVAMARFERERTAPLPEIAIILSTISFFLLPDEVAQQMVALRQLYFAFWLLPIAVTAVPFHRSKVRSLAVIGVILAWTIGRMAMLTDHLRRFEKDEMGGFDQIVAAAPRTPGLMVAYVALNARSPNWGTSPTYHSYGFLDAQRSYDGELEYSTKDSVAAVRYTEGPPLPVKHIYGNPNWPADPQVWLYDLVLVNRWSPTPAQRAAAEQHATLVASAGNWQLWQRR